MCKHNRDFSIISVKVTVCCSGCLFQSSHLSNSWGSRHAGYWWESTVLRALFAGVHLQLRFNASRYSCELMICHFECAGHCAQTLLWFLVLSWSLCLAVTCALQKQMCLAEFQWEAKCKNMNKALWYSCLETDSVAQSFIQAPKHYFTVLKLCCSTRKNIKSCTISGKWLMSSSCFGSECCLQTWIWWILGVGEPIISKSLLKCAFTYDRQTLIILRWPCAVHKMLRSSGQLTNWGDPVLLTGC